MIRLRETVTVLPTWAQGKCFDEVAFCKEFLKRHPMIYTEGSFFSPQGRLDTGTVRKQMFDYLSQYLASGISGRMRGLMDVLALACQQEPPKTPETKFFFANGSYCLGDADVVREETFCRTRFPVAYNPRAPKPWRWLSFLDDLLEETDILTLQEYLGYCLCPVNYAQKMLLIIGSGGEGKSRIGIVMQALMGSSMVNGSIAKLEKSPFARADLEHKLLMVDDDLRLDALSSTNYLKSIITAEQPLDLERKGIQSYQGRMHCRILAFGNGNLRALHDRSHGFFRRQIILTTKPLDPNRKTDPFLAQAIIREELEGVLLWCMEGLVRLLAQNLRFTLSPQAAANLNSAQEEGNNVTAFLGSRGYISFDPRYQIPTRRLYDIYRCWCDDNAEFPMAPKSFVSAVNDQARHYNICYSTHVSGGTGKEVRGFIGIAPTAF